MRMPMRAFLKMHTEAMIMEAAQFREQLDIAVTPSMKFQYYKDMRAKYNSIISRIAKIIPKKPVDMSLDIGSLEAQNLMRSVFGTMKRGIGYG